MRLSCSSREFSLDPFVHSRLTGLLQWMILMFEHCLSD